MKATKENVELLNKIGFTCDGKGFEEWYSLKSGWGFRLDAHSDFPSLMQAMVDYENEE